MSVRVDNLTKYYGDFCAVNNISFELKTGEVTGFLGPNGAGKSTTLKMITGILAPTSGQIFINGKNIKDNRKELAGLIGYLPENNPLYSDMFVADYLSFMASLSLLPQKKIAARVDELMQMCAISDQANKRIGELSKGYRQRVGLAQALVNDPPIVILDEPTSGLDPNQILEIRELIKNIGKEKTVIISSHILAEVEATCSRVIIMNKGEIVADAPAAELKSYTDKNYAYKVSLKNCDKVDIWSGIPDAVAEQLDNCSYIIRGSSANLAEEIFRYAVEKEIIITELVPYQEKLEDIFRKLTLNTAEK